MEITKATKLSDLLVRYPWLKEELSEVNGKFKMLNTPMGKVMMGKQRLPKWANEPAWMRMQSSKRSVI